MLVHKRQAVVDAALSYVGSPWRHQGRTRLGIDCAGLLVCAGHDAGVLSPKFDSTQYSRRPNTDEFSRMMLASGCKRIPVREATHGDILRLAEARWPVHAGILEVAQDGVYLIHSWATSGGVLRDPMTVRRWDQTRSAWRFPGIVEAQS